MTHCVTFEITASQLKLAGAVIVPLAALAGRAVATAAAAAEEERVVEPSARRRHRSKRAPKLLLLLLLPVVGAGEGTALRCQASFRTKDD